MHKFVVAGAEPIFLEKRSQDRRQPMEEERVRSTFARNMGIFLALAVAFSACAWKWRYLVYGPVWAARAHWADRSDLYVGKTNDIPNLNLVQQARNYLTQINQVDPSGNITDPASLQGVRLDIPWFQKHHPEKVDYNPFLSYDNNEGSYVVTWRYNPGCQETVWKSPQPDTDWFDPQGRPCYASSLVSVFMDRDLKLTALKMRPAQYPL
jgi:hypothetical protein